MQAVGITGLGDTGATHDLASQQLGDVEQAASTPPPAISSNKSTV